MGHAVGGGFLNAKNKEQAMKEGFADAKEFAFYNVDRGEDPSCSYHGNFRFYDKVFNSEEEAEDFFDSLGSYCDGVCMVKQAGKGAENRYHKQVAKINTKKREFFDKVIEKFKERTSKSVGCKKCGTRVASDIALKRNLRCPNCNNWMVPDTVKERYNKFDEQLALAKKQYNKDCEESGKIRYWAKYEVHC